MSMSMGSPSKKAFPLRITSALWRELQHLAAQDLRSINAEIEFLLRESILRRGIKIQDIKPDDDIPITVQEN